MAEKALTDFVEEATGTSHLRVEQDLGDGFVRLHTSEAERRQAAQDIQSSENILLEMMRNSKDAHATHIFVASSKEGALRTLTVIDDGDGIPKSMHYRIFEPRVTSKLDTSHMDAWGLHGRGMALFSITVNTRSAEVVLSEPGRGSALKVVSDTDVLPERTDQSTFPSFELKEGGEVSVRGPRNLLRQACEFAIENRNSCQVFIGSPAEIAAALYEYGMSTLSEVDRLFCKDRSELPLVKRLATSSSPSDLAGQCAAMGLEMSERTARRIMDGQVEIAQPLLERIVIKSADEPAAQKKRKGRHKGKAIKLQRAEIEHLQRTARIAFGPIAEAYYLSQDVEPSIKAGPESITITIPLIPSP